MEESLVSHSNIEAKIVILGEQSECCLLKLVRKRLVLSLPLCHHLWIDVGKTSFVVVFNPEGDTTDCNKLNRVSSTIGASFVTCRVRVKDKSVRMQVGVS